MQEGLRMESTRRARFGSGIAGAILFYGQLRPDVGVEVAAISSEHLRAGPSSEDSSTRPLTQVLSARLGMQRAPRDIHHRCERLTLACWAQAAWERMSMSNRIKVQLLLTREAQARGSAEVLQSRLRALGITVTGTGTATMSGEISPGDFKRLWKIVPPTEGGFTVQLDGPSLDVPESIAGDVASISLVPRHVTFNR